MKYAYCLLTALLAFQPVNLFAEDEEVKFSNSQLEYFETEIRPLLVKHCYECHSSKAKEIKGGLRVDARSLILKGGDTGPAVEPGNEESLFLDAVNYGDIYQMPPKYRLGQADVDKFAKWIREGAAWPDEAITQVDVGEHFDLEDRKDKHWVWKGPVKHRVPTVHNQDWTRRSLDNFILKKLEANELVPNDGANRTTLLRRAYFDLIGLPPTPQQVDAFLNNPAETQTAFEQVIDELLESPHFGERWARHWMDVVRYGESYGHEFDYGVPHAHQYRDYLIRAFNADVSYDQFVREHIAGDLLANPRLSASGHNESLRGTSFWWLGEAVHAPVDVRQDEADRIDNQIDVMGKAFLGMTIGCARCHDHKFDAISTKDYYALTGFMQSSRRDIRAVYPEPVMKSKLAEMAGLQSEISSQVATNISPETVLAGEQFAKYLLAVREVIVGTPKPEEKPEKTLLFEDFEDPDFEGWTVEGTAFGKEPITKETQGEYQGDQKAVGKGWANSHNIRDSGDVGKGDAHRGKLTSAPFKVGHQYIHFMICGGNHAGKTCINLVIDGKVVLSQPGFNTNVFRPVHWDVSAHLGKMAQIVAVDEQQGGWGNIGLDHIEFSNYPSATQQGRSAQAVAKEHGLDADILSRWVVALSDERVNDVQHPLNVWRQTMDLPSQALAGRLQAEAQRSSDSLSQAAEVLSRSPQLDGLTQWTTEWFAEGEAFPIKPTPSGTLDLRGETLQIFKTGSIDSGQLSNRLTGSFRSPTFELNHDAIQMRLTGKDVTARMILDGFFMYRYNGLLFGGFSTSVNADTMPRWHRLQGDVRRYKGHKAFIEFLDTGNGSVSIEDIRQTSEGSPREIPNTLILDVVNESVKDHIQFAASYGQQWEVALQAWHEAQLSAEQVSLINWALRHKLITIPETIQESVQQQWTVFREIESSLPAPEHVLVMADGSGENEKIFIRGNHKALGEEAPRQLLSAIVGDAPVESHGSGRMQLADDILADNNPLTSRVMVNRLWHHLFGKGIVASTNNFGVLGARPSHPELLDHLAIRFVEEHNWSIKSMLKEIMLSSTYQMDSTPNPDYIEVDPNNSLLYRQNIRRLEGEAIRDSILAISGRLDRKQFGPSVPVFVTPFMTGRGRPGSGPLDGAGRRSVYIGIRRNFLSPMMLAFDMPIPFNSVGRRNVSNVPSQALILMNDPFVVEQAKLWGKRISAIADLSMEEKLKQMYLEAFARNPSPEEITDASEFMIIQAMEYNIPADKLTTDERLWADLGHVLINTKRFIYIH
tara:strand:- start:5651 stop:9466 length:3816 start_codon:yes stop_codon:yes gene_type:complete